MKIEGQEQTCHFRRHLKGAELSVYEQMSSLAAPPERLCWASNATLKNGSKYSQDSISRARKELVRNGWLVAYGGNTKFARSGGHFQPNKYRVLTHEEWAAAHPGQCPEWNHPNGKSTARTESGMTVAGNCGLSVTAKPLHKSSYESKEEVKVEIASIPCLHANSKAYFDAENPWKAIGLEKECGSPEFAGLWNEAYSLQRQIFTLTAPTRGIKQREAAGTGLVTALLSVVEHCDRSRFAPAHEANRRIELPHEFSEQVRPIFIGGIPACWCCGDFFRFWSVREHHGDLFAGFSLYCGCAHPRFIQKCCRRCAVHCTCGMA